MKYARTYRLFAFVLLTAACSNSSTIPDDPVILDPGVAVPHNPSFETYVTNDTGSNRVRSDLSRPSDKTIIAQFEDANPDSPAGYRSVIDLNDKIYSSDVRIEVLAQVATNGSAESVTRLLRLTADQAPLEHVPGAAGRYYFRGHNFAWVTIDDGPVLSGRDRRGLVNLVLDFDNGTADINLRTGVGGASVVRTEIDVTGLPFNIRSGAFGGPITVEVYDRDNPSIYKIEGSLRANVGGTPAFADSLHGLTASGLYTATGMDQGADVRIEGAFVGIDPDALP